MNKINIKEFLNEYDSIGELDGKIKAIEKLKGDLFNLPNQSSIINQPYHKSSNTRYFVPNSNGVYLELSMDKPYTAETEIYDFTMITPNQKVKLIEFNKLNMNYQSIIEEMESSLPYQLSTKKAVQLMADLEEPLIIQTFDNVLINNADVKEVFFSQLYEKSKILNKQQKLDASLSFNDGYDVKQLSLVDNYIELLNGIELEEMSEEAYYYLMKFQEAKEFVENKIQGLEAQIEFAEREKGYNLLNNKQEEIEILTQEVIEGQNKLFELNQEVERLGSEIENKQDDLELLNNKKYSLMDNIRKIPQKAKGVLTSEVTELTLEKEHAKTEYDEFKSDCDKLSSSLEKKGAWKLSLKGMEGLKYDFTTDYIEGADAVIVEMSENPYNEAMNIYRTKLEQNRLDKSMYEKVLSAQESEVKVDDGVKLNTEIDTPKKLVDFFKGELGNSDYETSALICFNDKNEPIAFNELSIKFSDETFIHPKELLKIAILNDAATIATIQNNSMEILKPSTADLMMTHKLNLCCEIMDIKFLDHILVNSLADNFYSVREEAPSVFEKIIENVGMKL